jgi:hypothetical protein
MAQRKVHVVAGISFDMEPVDAIEGSVTAGEQRFDFVLSAAQHEDGTMFERPDNAWPPFNYRYRVFLRSGVPSQRPSYESRLLTTESSAIVVDPRELYRHIKVRATAVFDFDRYREVFVDVKAQMGKGDWSRTETMGMTPDSRYGEAWFVVDADGQPTFEQRYRYVTRPGEVIELPWQPLGEGTLAVGNPPVSPAGIV